MTLHCIQAARSFRPERHLPLSIGDTRIGWIGTDDVSLLARWPEVFELAGEAVRLAPALDTAERRSAALGQVIRQLADAGRIRGWRNELYGIRNHFDQPALALIERAAARFFGVRTYGAHVNGIMPGGDAPRLWVARRSLSKPIDPGLFDNLAGGGIGWGYGVFETAVKECWEESGVPAPLAGAASPGRTVELLSQLPEGVQWEQIFVYDLLLPGDFRPGAQDGEVSEHRLLGLPEVRALIAAGEMTVDASLVTLDWLLRAGHLDPALPELAGIDALWGAAQP